MTRRILKTFLILALVVGAIQIARTFMNMPNTAIPNALAGQPGV